MAGCWLHMDGVESLSHIGRFQIFHFICIVIISISPVLWHTYSIVFQGFTNSHHCKVPENVSVHDVIPVSVGLDGTAKLAQCEKYTFPGGNHTVPCDSGYEYGDEYFPSGDGTIVSEWDLVCDKRNYVEYAVTAQTSGILLGAFTCGTLGDRFGRRHVLFGNLFLLGSLSMIMAFVPNFTAFCVINCGRGITIAGLYLSAIVLGTEVLSQRTSANAFVGVCFGLSHLVMVLLSYYLRRWRHLQIAISALTLVSVIYRRWCPESVRWYLAHGRVKDAKELLQRQAQTNGCVFKECDLELCVNKLMAQYSKQTEDMNGKVDGVSAISGAKYKGKIPQRVANTQNSIQHNTVIAATPVSLLRLICKPKILLFTLGLGYQCFLSELNIFGMQLLQAKLRGNIFTINAISATIGIPGNILGYFMMDRLGRKLTLIFCLLMLTAHFVVTAILIILTDLGIRNFETLATWIAVLAKPFIMMHWITFVVFGQELSPTSVRATLFGLQAVGGFVGTILAPFIAVTAMLVFPWLPLALFGVLSLIGVLFALVLPETLGRGLPSSMDDIMNYPRHLTKEETDSVRREWKKRRLIGFVNSGLRLDDEICKREENVSAVESNFENTHL